jgi:hypothetical protein
MVFDFVSFCWMHRNRSSRRRMHLCMQDDQNGQKMIVLTSAEETRLTCFILLQNIFFWSNQPSLTADVNTIINLPWYPRKIVHFSLVLSPSRVYYDFYGWMSLHHSRLHRDYFSFYFCLLTNSFIRGKDFRINIRWYLISSSWINFH